MAALRRLRRRPITLDQTGTYTLAYEGTYSATGTNGYSFVLGRVTDDAARADARPDRERERSRSRADRRWSFGLAAPAMVYLDALSAESSQLTWQILGADGTVYFDGRPRYEGRRRLVLPRVLALPAGSYNRGVRADGAATGPTASASRPRHGGRR